MGGHSMAGQAELGTPYKDRQLAGPRAYTGMTRQAGLGMQSRAGQGRAYLFGPMAASSFFRIGVAKIIRLGQVPEATLAKVIKGS